MEKHTLIQKLVSRLPICTLYPTKHKKKEKEPLNYIHVSQRPVKYKGEDGIVHEGFVGVTYRKPII